MPTREYADGAVEDLAAYLETNLPACVVTQATQTGYTLPAPSVYRRAVHPSAVEQCAIEVECLSWVQEDLHNEYWFFDCEVHVVLRGSDADIITTQKRLRAYVSAIIRCIEDDPSLGSLVVDAEIEGGDFAGASQEGQLQGVGTVRVTVKRHQT